MVLYHTIFSCVSSINTGMPAVVLVHGGASSVPDDLTKAVVDGVKMAALDGFSVLEGGGSTLDAVEAAVRNMEDNVEFNAGKIPIFLKTPDCAKAHWLHLLVLMPKFM